MNPKKCQLRLKKQDFIYLEHIALCSKRNLWEIVLTLSLLKLFSSFDRKIKCYINWKWLREKIETDLLWNGEQLLGLATMHDEEEASNSNAEDAKRNWLLLQV